MPLDLFRRLILPAATSLLGGCAALTNYVEPDGPRYAADHASRDALRAPGEALRVVSYNVQFGERIDEAIRELAERPELKDADVILLQEMDAEGVDAIARALHLSYVYYPASVHTNGRDFGNAILTPWRIRADRKVVLPHASPTNAQRRIAVRAEIETDRLTFAAYSVHTETPWLGLKARLEQARAVVEDAGDGLPAVIGGDFNTADPGSIAQTREIFARGHFEHVTGGVGGTKKTGPFNFGLDHVFTRGFEARAAGKIANNEASDHAPVWVELGAPSKVARLD